MSQQSRKNLTDKNRSAEFDTEIEYQDKSRPNAKPSEPSRTSNSSKPSAIDKEKVANSGAAKKNV